MDVHPLQLRSIHRREKQSSMLVHGMRWHPSYKPLCVFHI